MLFELWQFISIQIYFKFYGVLKNQETRALGEERHGYREGKYGLITKLIKRRVYK